ncbi:uncharacterized protein LOC132270551 [Cornus florida]|uniref:uncharacterized protein LOC132270551 n=1 Tax=Cornus florida TaxID=4283 RepID=UPI00289B4F38|nr:uncharacterized protein LOC132270551 [Cornus florida]
MANPGGFRSNTNGCPFFAIYVIPLEVPQSSPSQPLIFELSCPAISDSKSTVTSTVHLPPQDLAPGYASSSSVSTSHLTVPDSGQWATVEAQYPILKKELAKAWGNEEIFWKQKSRLSWLNLGDKNTAFFHRKTMIRRRKNEISGIEDDQGIWHDVANVMRGTAEQYFRSLFTSESLNPISDFWSLVPNLISDEMNGDLLRRGTEAELKLPLSTMGPFKDPRPDGFTPLFFQNNWAVVKDDLLNGFNSFLDSGHMLWSINHNNLVLIPKVKHPTRMSHFRPISLCNVIYRIFSKILANRLRPLMNILVSNHQPAFVPNQLIHENILLVHEFMHYLKSKSSGKRGFLAFKLDMEKAYNQIEWSFLEGMRKGFSFHSKWVSVIMSCVTSVSFSITINAVSGSCFQPSRDLRQGDPLSPFLFLLCVEGLSFLLKQAECNHSIHGVKIGPSVPSVSHMLFADDFILFCRAEDPEVSNLMGILDLYSALSGQRVNFSKSGVFFSKNTDPSFCLSLSRILRIEPSNWVNKYLGLPSLIHRSKAEAFKFLKERIEAKVRTMKGDMLSRAGRKTMLKSFMAALPTYTLQCYKIPSSVAKAITSKFRVFWWSGKADGNPINWLIWNSLCGGLGFRDLEDFNLALLSKFGCRMEMGSDFNDQSLFFTVFKQKYFRDKSFLESRCPANASWGWRSISASKNLIKKGISWVVGDGSSICIREDNWLLDPGKPFISSPSLNPSFQMVEELIDHNTRSWNSALIHQLFNFRDSNLILQIPLGLSSGSYCRVWSPSSDGKFSVRSAYRLARSLRELDCSCIPSYSHSQMRLSLWQSIWKIQATRKILCFLWQCYHERIPDLTKLQSRRISVDNTCFKCGLHDESIGHSIFSCPFSRVVWKALPLRVEFCDAENGSWPQIWSSLLSVWSQSPLFKDFCSLGASICWNIWKARNALLFKKSGIEVLEVVTKAVSDFHEFSEIVAQHALFALPRVEAPPPPSRWFPPTVGRVKLNFDASFSVGCQECGGEMAEALILRRCLALIRDWGYSNVDVEGDCLSIMTLSPLSSALSSMIDFIKLLMISFMGCNLIWSPHSCNNVAHAISRFSLRHRSTELCWDVWPKWLLDVCYRDFSPLPP